MNIALNNLLNQDNVNQKDKLQIVGELLSQCYLETLVNRPIKSLTGVKTLRRHFEKPNLNSFPPHPHDDDGVQFVNC